MYSLRGKHAFYPQSNMEEKKDQFELNIETFHL